MPLREAAAILLLGAIGPSTVLGDSNVSFRRALSVCSGTLGSVSFAAGHARIAATEGVEIEESEADENAVVNVTLQMENGAKSARVALDQRRRTVHAKNARRELNGRVACILPD